MEFDSPSAVLSRGCKLRWTDTPYSNPQKRGGETKVGKGVLKNWPLSPNSVGERHPADPKIGACLELGG